MQKIVYKKKILSLNWPFLLFTCTCCYRSEYNYHHALQLSNQNFLAFLLFQFDHIEETVTDNIDYMLVPIKNTNLLVFVTKTETISNDQECACSQPTNQVSSLF